MEPNVISVSSRRAEGWRSLSDLPDDRLVELAHQKDRAAFEALMRRHNRRLYRVTRGVLRDGDRAQDAVQQTWLRAYTRLDTYRPEGKFGAWITRVALNEALTIRRQSPAPTMPLDDSMPSEQPGAEQYVEAAHARELLEHALDALPENFRMVFVLRVVEGLDVRETSESLEINPTTVRTRLFRAHRQLRADLSQRLRGESSGIFDFGAENCDRVVASVLEKLPD